ncbi:HDIG domain-containing protein [Micromonospora sp. WMMC241]|uniref:HDIG domain-containing metalloprotein n=1 Tax=Micromonospora sp. WMMC241 TaxID=3015159 RepID=UPI0022B747FC|nr:HDIG domain-containing metalloprotein [Micromonospora sp. WMMC241]MCZ7437240.1 HDIG domain-containing protein [Micromonospora sp. WMMC241]
MTIDHRTAVPTDERIRSLHERFAPTEEAFRLVWTHCRIVCEIAEDLLGRHDAGLDHALVRAGSLLHDIGVYRLYDAHGRLDQRNYVRHGVLGHALLRDAGLPESLGGFCSRHTGVGITREDVLRQRLPLPVADHTPRTGEENLVMYADKFHSKTTPPTFVSAATYAVTVGRFGADKAARFTALVERFGEPDLAALARRHGHPVT